MSHHADIDLDFGDRIDIIDIIKCTPAQIEVKGEKRKHNSGVYIQAIPVDPIIDTASLSYKDADDRGYFKLDFLNVSIYKHIRDYEHYDELLALEPPWHRLAEKEFVEQIIHIGNYHDMLSEMLPDSIPRMGMFISAIRPAKRYLLGKPWNIIAESIWTKPKNNQYYFKQAHAISYAMLVALHMNIVHTT